MASPHALRHLPMLAAALGLLATSAAFSQETTSGDLRGGSVSGSAGGRDNTRAMGVAYDSQGNTMEKVQIWVMNDTAPANRVRARTRKTGDYLVRSLATLYTEDDVLGIQLRLSFEAPGYQTVELTAGVERDGLVEVHPILWKEGESPAPTDDWCLMLKGRVTNAKGKGIKEASITVTDPAGSELKVQATTQKDGSYEALLWEVPATLTVTADVGGTEQTETFTLAGTPRADVLASAEKSFSF